MKLKLLGLACLVATATGCASFENRVRREVWNEVDLKLVQFKSVVIMTPCTLLPTKYDEFRDGIKKEIIKDEN